MYFHTQEYMTKQKLGIIQSRGLGDILIAIPIANYYYQQDWEIHWPICQQFHSHMRDVVPWVNWIPIPLDNRGNFFYTEPERRLKNLKCHDIMCFYQALNQRPELSQTPWFQIQKFDEFKYTKAGVPFLAKWQLGDMITRNPTREIELYNKIVTNPLYAVVHTEGSNYRCDIDLDYLPTDWQIIRINETTDCIFDWLKIIEGCQAFIGIDSVFTNLVDQLQLNIDKYWIPRSHIHLTPVLGSNWTILDPPQDSLAAKQIFSPGPS